MSNDKNNSLTSSFAQTSGGIVRVAHKVDPMEAMRQELQQRREWVAENALSDAGRAKYKAENKKPNMN